MIFYFLFFPSVPIVEEKENVMDMFAKKLAQVTKYHESVHLKDVL